MASEQKTTYTNIPMTTTTTLPQSTPNVHMKDPSITIPSVSSTPQMIGGNTFKYDLLKQSMPGVSIFLRPYAAPSALGFASFFAASWIVSTWYCDW